MGMKQNDPIRTAIDLGGGQTCDVEGVLRELKKAGYAIVKIKYRCTQCGWIVDTESKPEFQGGH